jgi:hypothetical protein
MRDGRRVPRNRGGYGRAGAPTDVYDPRARISAVAFLMRVVVSSLALVFQGLEERRTAYTSCQ